MNYSNQSHDAPTVKWYAHQVTLEETKSDTLILLDCCSAGGSGGDATRGVKEVIAACGFETWTPGVGQHSFTKSLIDELKYLSSGPSFSASGLHSRLLDRLKQWNPVYNAERLLVEDEAGRFQDKERRKTPVYISLNKSTKPKSIELVSLRHSRADEGSSAIGIDQGSGVDTLDSLDRFLQDRQYAHIEATISI